jgi:hypothetical protein
MSFGCCYLHTKSITLENVWTRERSPELNLSQDSLRNERQLSKNMCGQGVTHINRMNAVTIVLERFHMNLDGDGLTTLQLSTVNLIISLLPPAPQRGVSTIFYGPFQENRRAWGLARHGLNLSCKHGWVGMADGFCLVLLSNRIVCGLADEYIKP